MDSTKLDPIKASHDKFDFKCPMKKFFEVKDWRRITYCFKVGLALSLVSLFVLLQDIYDKLGNNAIWAILTVVLVFEYTVGATLSKGLNRGLGTIMAAFLGLLVDYFANFLGPKVEPYVVGFSVFIVGFMSTYTRSVPSIKAKFDYAMVIFLLTFCLVVITSGRVSDNIDVVFDRIVTVMLGIVICIGISVFIFPIWAGDDLHKLVIENFEDLANSLEECLHQYFEGVPELLHIPSNICKDQPYDDKVYKAYRGLLVSKQTQESLATFASWEPKRGGLGCTYPWKKLVEVGAILRHLAYIASTLHGCVISEIQAPNVVRRVFARPCLRVGKEIVAVLREIALDITHNHKSRPKDCILERVREAINDLKCFVKENQLELLHYPNFKNITPDQSVNLDLHTCDHDIGEIVILNTADILQESTMFIQSLSIASVIVLLIEIATRFENLLNAIVVYQHEAGMKTRVLQQLKFVLIPSDIDKP